MVRENYNYFRGVRVSREGENVVGGREPKETFFRTQYSSPQQKISVHRKKCGNFGGSGPLDDGFLQK